MKKINKKLIWLVLAFPLVGCETVPLNQNTSQLKKAEVVVAQKPTLPHIVRTPPTVETLPVDQVGTRFNGTTNLTVSPIPLVKSNVPELVSVDPISPDDIKDLKSKVGGREVAVDPNVKLIAPPTALPKTRYALPEVEEKETYVPPPAYVEKKSKKQLREEARASKGKKTTAKNGDSKSKKVNKVANKSVKKVANKSVKKVTKKSVKKVTKKSTKTNK